MNGVVFDIQRAALHDGPGLRTVVFLKGCPLRCRWCHNPESQQLAPETGRSGKVYGRLMSVAEALQPVLADRPFYGPQGGLTVSGGEPTVQIDFCCALLQAAGQAGVQTCLDTCGHFPTAYLERLLPLVDLWHWDVKATAAAHRSLTGVDDALIQDNLERLCAAGARIRLRCPVVPGLNDHPADRQRLDALRADPAFEAVEELPYHDHAAGKYADLARTMPDV